MSAEIIPLTIKRAPGATPQEWSHFDVLLGLTEDLLPVVCNTAAKISPRSKLVPSQIGRVPSLYDAQGWMVGIPGWTKSVATGAEIDAWMKVADLGICINTRKTRLFDLDVTNTGLVERIHARIEEELGLVLPVRRREGTAKRGLCVEIEGQLGKRRLEVEGGEFIEFLGNGQMFVAAGSRADGSRYFWDGGLPEAIPVITAEQFERVWSMLEKEFGVSPAVKSTPLVEMGPDLDIEDPVAGWLLEQGLVLGESGRGLIIACPWEEEHSSGETGDSSTMWMLAGGKGHEIGHFRCLHAHCAHRSRGDFLEAVGYCEDVSVKFDAIEDTPEEKAERKAKADRFTFIPVGEVVKLPSPGWVIKGVIPKAELGIVYGPSGSGKSFVMLDLGMAIARGVPWRGHKVTQGRVRYIVAEGRGGFRKRLKAYGMHHDVDLDQVPMAVMETAPNFLLKDDVKAVMGAIKASEGADVIIVDTFAKVTAGANENAGEDMGEALDNCRRISEATGALVILVHHTGKDVDRGARGWSGIRAAADFEAEVCKEDASGKRWLQITKQKDGDDDGRWGFNLVDVIVGLDEDDEPITSCVLGDDEAPEKGRTRQAKPEKLGAWEQAVLETFAVLQLGGDVPRTELIIQVGERMRDTVGGTIKSRRARARRALDGLCSGKKSLLFVDGDMVVEV